MLVISRKSQECIQIGDEIVVKVIKTARGSVKIGIDAPGGTRVLRGELCEEGLENDQPFPADAPLSLRIRQVYAHADDSARQPVEVL